MSRQEEPVPLEYLRDPNYSSYDVELTVSITPAAGGAPTVVSTSNYKNQYWTCRQQLVHHAVSGCDMQPGDMYASGTISGTEANSYGSMLELCWQGTKEVRHAIRRPAVTPHVTPLRNGRSGRSRTLHLHVTRAALGPYTFT